jgi:hypothetical protein
MSHDRKYPDGQGGYTEDKYYNKSSGSVFLVEYFFDGDVALIDVFLTKAGAEAKIAEYPLERIEGEFKVREVPI